MFKKMLKIVLAVAGIALIGLGTINEAKAETGIYEGEFSCNNFKIKLISVVRDGNEYNYNYVVLGGALPVSKISYLNLGIDEYFYLSASAGGVPAGTLQEPGIGGQDGWLAGVPQLQTMTFNPQEVTETDPLTITVTGDAGVHEGLIAVYAKAGNKVDYCFAYGPVPPPSCPDLPIDVTVPQTKQVALLRGSQVTDYCIDIDPRTGCPYQDAKPYICDTNPKEYLELDGNFKIGGTEEGGPDKPTMIMGEGDDPRCPVVKAAHNPCQWIILTGRPYGPVCW